MPFGQRIQKLRKNSWFHDELAQQIASDARQIGRKENGKSTPSVFEQHLS